MNTPSSKVPGALQIVCQVALLLLLYGTIVGDFALLADVGARAVRKLTPTPPELLVGFGGRGMMVLLALCPVLPLCLLRRQAHNGSFWALLSACQLNLRIHACLPIT